MHPLLMGKCHPNEGFLAVASLDELVEIDGDEVSLLDEYPDPCSEGESGLYLADRIVDVRRFVNNLPRRLSEIAYRTYWRDESQTHIAEALGMSKSGVCQALARINRLGRTHLCLALA